MPTPSPDEVLIGVAFTGICGSDLHGYRGKSGRRTPEMVMGHESSGWVCEVGSNSKKSLIGERVTFNPAISCVGTCGHGIENHCQQVARAEGCASVTISESMSSRRDLAASLGFDTTTPETVSELPKFDKAFDAVGIDATAAATKHSSAPEI